MAKPPQVIGIQAGDILQNTDKAIDEEKSVYIVNPDLKTATNSRGHDYYFPIDDFSKKYNTTIVRRNDLKDKYFKGK